MTVSIVVIGLITYESKSFDTQTLITVLAVVWGIVAIIDLTQAVLLRSREISGNHMTAELYAFISDELATRSIRNARRFITEHPEYDRACYEAMAEVHHTVGENKTLEMGALVYGVDGDPERTREVLTAVVNDRGITNVVEVRAMLHEMVSAKQAIRSGAL